MGQRGLSGYLGTSDRQNLRRLWNNVKMLCRSVELLRVGGAGQQLGTRKVHEQSGVRHSPGAPSAETMHLNSSVLVCSNYFQVALMLFFQVRIFVSQHQKLFMLLK